MSYQRKIFQLDRYYPWMKQWQTGMTTYSYPTAIEWFNTRTHMNPYEGYRIIDKRTGKLLRYQKSMFAKGCNRNPIAPYPYKDA